MRLLLGPWGPTKLTNIIRDVGLLNNDGQENNWNWRKHVKNPGPEDQVLHVRRIDSDKLLWCKLSVFNETS